jgi:methionyl-tRNA synthetase
MTIFIGGAWPYANGSLHLGRVASLLPGDVLARYFRLKGEDVLYVSGSDCHGTPISIQADQEGVEPARIADRYHAEFADCFAKLGFSYDLYTRTDDPFHHRVVQELFTDLLEKGYLYLKETEMTYCASCEQFLPDRYVEGTCPHCGQAARGDQCDYCSALLDPVDMHDRRCKLCGSRPATRLTEHYYFALSKLQESIERYVEEKAPLWRDNAVKLTGRYLQLGLHDRAATRDLSWGVDVPGAGAAGKKIYVWIEAVCGYLSASMKWAHERQSDWRRYWTDEATAYYVHGKDNIPFHTLIWPGLLLGAGGLHLPDRIVSGEYLTLEGRKFSTSRNWAVWLPEMLERYHPDSIRYFLLVNGPEKGDADFSWREFIYSHNGELLGAFGNLVNRSLVFLQKSFDGKVPAGVMDGNVQAWIEELYERTGRLLEEGSCKEALEAIFGVVRQANKYFDERKPWVQRKEQPAACADTLYTCVQIIANLSNLLEPFLPFSSRRIREFLQMEAPAAWKAVEVKPHTPIGDIGVLFDRIDVARIQEETDRLAEAKR